MSMDLYRIVARAVHGSDEIEIDADAKVSPATDGGCWVAAWVYISNETIDEHDPSLRKPVSKQVQRAASNYVNHVVEQYGAASALARTRRMTHEHRPYRQPQWLTRSIEMLTEIVKAAEERRRNLSLPGEILAHPTRSPAAPWKPCSFD